MYCVAEQWEYIGVCIYCGAACYSKGGEFKGTSTDTDCICAVEKEEKDKNEIQP